MRIDWDAFTSEITTLMKTSGDTGDSGDTHRKGLNQNDKVVTARLPNLSPLAKTGDTHATASGDAFVESKQSVTEPVTGVTAVTGRFQRGQSAFTECIIHLQLTAATDDLGVDRWRRVINDSVAFVATWGDKAAQFGWTAIDLFGVHPTHPACRFDLMGLIPSIDGGEVVAITATSATIRKPSGSIQRYTRRDQRAAVLIWEVRG